MLHLDDEHLLVIPDKYGTAAIRGKDPPNRYRHIFLHKQSLSVGWQKTSLHHGRFHRESPVGKHLGYYLPFPSRSASVKTARLKIAQKFVSYEELADWRKSVRESGRKLVVTHGCFDLLHAGHVTYLESARDQGDLLLVGVNGDDAVRALKGEGRPINQEQDRATVIAALESVTHACVFPDVNAAEFLRRSQPDVWVKGGDYTLETLNQEERQIVQQAGGTIALISFVPGKSTTRLVEKITRL